MQFSKLFVVFTILIVAFAGQSEASWWKKVFKPVEKLGQRVRDATIQGLGIAQQVKLVGERKSSSQWKNLVNESVMLPFRESELLSKVLMFWQPFEVVPHSECFLKLIYSSIC
ncbi:unnamed protein product [Hermetia illucens]|uniref:Uncharacterized protein n=1 Tax=Hermetia illucens TaxID=343691 RepID=A0A7R8V102_HERIL|nr:unnamed protein product [Hermetia illucens]